MAAVHCTVKMSDGIPLCAERAAVIYEFLETSGGKVEKKKEVNSSPYKQDLRIKSQILHIVW